MLGTRVSERALVVEQLVSHRALASEFSTLRPNQWFQPTSLPPATFPSTCGRLLGGKAAAEPRCWAAGQGYENSQVCAASVRFQS